MITQPTNQGHVYVRDSLREAVKKYNIAEVNLEEIYKLFERNYDIFLINPLTKEDFDKLLECIKQAPLGQEHDSLEENLNHLDGIIYFITCASISAPRLLRGAGEITEATLDFLHSLVEMRSQLGYSEENLNKTNVQASAVAYNLLSNFDNLKFAFGSDRGAEDQNFILMRCIRKAFTMVSLLESDNLDNLSFPLEECDSLERSDVVREELLAASNDLAENTSKFIETLSRFVKSDCPRLEETDFSQLETNLKNLKDDSIKDKLFSNFLDLALATTSGPNADKTFNYALRLAAMCIPTYPSDLEVIQEKLVTLKIELGKNCAFSVPDGEVDQAKAKGLIGYIDKISELEQIGKKLSLAHTNEFRLFITSLNEDDREMINIMIDVVPIPTPRI